MILIRSILVLFIVLALPPAGFGDDHDRARAARERGEIRPLEDILPSVRQRFPGDVVRIELENEHDRWIYEIKLISPDGRLVELDVDAGSGDVIEVEGE
ncbi:putative membrane protein YkoI [Inquilinus ginsengisoli]|uniref:Membrane protein YkoI n=1 Tax=Inquilinus ginsengisoli TaxID=363840 RepID=A0ABU1JHP6_9PROT|nr:PepSY domain-containing protein [Inquilinus ginsengisoli]MDR6288144.1 putative membrane protein YkoI [Inquilinus ginsengisoli]